MSLERNKRWTLLDPVEISARRPRNPYYDVGAHGVSCHRPRNGICAIWGCGYCASDYPDAMKEVKLQTPEYLEIRKYKPYHYQITQTEIEGILGISLQHCIDNLKQNVRLRRLWESWTRLADICGRF